jgi:hypothetical protein
MNASASRLFRLYALVALSLLLTACAAGDPQFTQDNPAGFWYGLWHGVIAVIALIIHVFNENVAVYEIHNIGGWYDCGFLLGVIMIWSGGSHVSCKSTRTKQRDKEWEEISEKVGNKIMRKLNAWAEDEKGELSPEEWEQVGEKVEKKLKRKIREWAEKD